MAPLPPKPDVAPKRKFSWIGFATSLGLVVSIAAVLLAFFSGFGTKWGWWDFRHGLGYFRDSVYFGGAGLLLSVFARGWSLIAKSHLGGIRSTFGLVMGLLIVGNFLFWLHQAQGAARIHGITTDTVNPPVFEAILPLRQSALNPPEYGGAKIAEQQQKAYPDIQPLFLNAPPNKAWEACLAAAQKMGWAIVAMDEPKGRIEATDTTFWFGFKDDVVARVAADRPGWSRVDVRSVSRVGLGDVGTNAKRIRKFLGQLQPDKGAY